MIVWAGSKRLLRVAVAIALALFVVATTAHAQVASNPTTLLFTPSNDHNAVDADGNPIVSYYEFDIYQQGESQPVTVVNIGKPSPAEDGYIYVEFTRLIGSRPAGTLEARVAVVGPSGRADSMPSNAFSFDVMPPPAPTPDPTPAPAPAPSSPTSGGTSPGGTVAIRITNPSSGITLNVPTTLRLSASVTTDGTPVSAVNFFANGALVGMATSTPYQVLWTNGAAGAYSIVAIAVAANGEQARSASVAVSLSTATGSRGGTGRRVEPAGARTTGQARAKQK